MREISPGIWSWATRHPEWHPGEFGAEVVSYALRQGRDTLLIDPLLPEEKTQAFLGKLDAVVRGRLTIAVTLGYHTRSAAPLASRYEGTRHVEIIGPKGVELRLSKGAPFKAISAGDKLPFGITAYAVGSPRRQELPLLVPKAKALVFADTIVEHRGELRLWDQRKQDAKRRRWTRERLIPTLEPLLELDFDRVLVTHGNPVLRGGRKALKRALEAGGWYHCPA